MKKPQFTITLAKSGQRVVKESDTDYDGRHFDGPVRKRHLEETSVRGDYDGLGFNGPVSKRLLGGRIADGSLDYNSKRMRHDESTRGYESNKQTDDSRVGPNDLRVKLMQKEISKRAQLEIAERKKRELYEKVSRAIKSAELEESRTRNTTLSRKVEEPRQMDTMKSSYVSPMFNGVKPRSPGRVIRYPDGISNYMNPIDERPQLLPMKQFDAPRTGHSFNEMPARSPDRVIRYSSGISNHINPIDEHPQVAPLRQLYSPRAGHAFITDPVDSTRISVPLPTASRAPINSGRMITHLDSGWMVTQLPLGTGGMSRPPYPENQPQPYTESGMLGPRYPENQPQPVTVSSLLNTIGLGKYAITFQAEEIDMLALRQIGDRDLKEMGIPMGPRKKILHAVEAHTKRLIAQARSNYMQSIEFAR